MTENQGESDQKDPMPWRHVSGVRVSDPWAKGAPIGGYTYDPREGFADYPDRYVSTNRTRSNWSPSEAGRDRGLRPDGSGPR